jgi:Spy/CpxP family protein refolding chaperone
MSKRNIFLISSVIFISFSQGCDRDSSVKKYTRSHFRRPPHERSHGDITRFGFGSIEKMAKDLNLSDEQVEELKKIEEEMLEKREQMREIRKGRETIKQKMVELIKQDSLSKEEVLNFMHELHSLKEEYRMAMDSLMAERLAKTHSVLSEKQREKLAQKIAEFEPKRKFKPEKDKK